MTELLFIETAGLLDDETRAGGHRTKTRLTQKADQILRTRAIFVDRFRTVIDVEV